MAKKNKGPVKILVKDGVKLADNPIKPVDMTPKPMKKVWSAAGKKFIWV